MKIAIATMHAARNYGAVLQTYALQHYYENAGCDVEIINYKLPNQSTKGYLLNINSKFKKNVFLKMAYLANTIIPKYKTTRLFFDFQKRKLNLSSPVILENGKVKGYPNADVYCAGSDQIWNPRANGGFNPVYFLLEAPGRKVSYASSIGVFDLTESEKEQIKYLLSEFENISIRELSSVLLLRKIGYDVKCVLDPTLLLTQEEWESFSNKTVEGQPYLLVYFFGNAKNIMNTASMIARKRGLRIRRITVGFDRYTHDETIERFVTPERFVDLFLNASYVITNSFHGTVFSINFHKQFLSYPTTENNARFDSVFQMFDLKSRNLRLYSGMEVLDLQDIDYKLVSNILEARRQESAKYIKCILKEEEWT